MNKDDWWKYSDSFLQVTMNTAETKEVSREDINSLLLEALGQWWDLNCAGPLPFADYADYAIDIGWDAGTASFTITKNSEPLSWGYFSSPYDDFDIAWDCVEHHYLRLTDQSELAWSLPAKPASKPFLALIRREGGLRCDCEACQQRATRGEPDAPLKHSRVWLGALESALGFILLKEGFRKELYEDEP